MTISRRHLFATGAMVAGAAATLPMAGRALAQAAPTPAPAATPVGQVPSAYRYKVGDATVTALCDGAFSMPLGASFVRNAPLEEVQKALAEARMPTDTLHISFTTLLIENGAQKVLIDSGFADNGPATAGRLAAALGIAGLKPADVTHVLISHFHGDHIAGLRRKDGSATFPNAEVAVPEAEWAYWLDDGKMAQAPEALKGNFSAVRRVFAPMAPSVRRFAWGKEVLPGITAVEASGHTPGHTAFAVTSGNGRLLVLSDTTNVPYLFVRRPDWQVMFDMDPELARSNRHRLLDMAASEGMQVAGYHFPFPATGYIGRDGKGYALDPVVWRAAL